MTDPDWAIDRQQPKRRAVGFLAHDRLIVVAALALAMALAAAVTISGGGTGMSALEMTAATGPGGAILTGAETAPGGGAWSPGFALATVLMWWLMMVAMMVPGAVPAVLLYAALTSGARPPGGPALALLSGYLLAWMGFSLVATFLQWALVSASQLSPMFLSLTSRPPAAALLLLAGLYQFTPLKARCLGACNAPAALLVAHRPRGRWGSLRAGLRLGRYCMGCCWALMLLLFVGGAMNLYWIVGLALIVAAEKLLPMGLVFARALGLALIAAGAALFWL